MSAPDEPEGPEEPDAPVIEPSGIGQFIAHDRCPRFIKQRVDPGDEPEARDWTEAYNLMNVALLGHGREFEARQVEALATGATTIIGPELGDRSKRGVPDIELDETWRDSARGRKQQIQRAVKAAKEVRGSADERPFVLLFQAPLGGAIGDFEVWGEADCIALLPADHAGGDDTNGSDEDNQDEASGADVVARVIEIKSGHTDKPANRAQVAIYSTLLERTLGEGPAVRIETSVLTAEKPATPGEDNHPLDLPTFRRAEWELYAKRLLKADGSIDEALGDELDELPYALDQVCNNCAYREACATRAVEDPTGPASLALLGLDASIQRQLRGAGLGSLNAVSELLDRPNEPQPGDDPPPLDLDPELRRTLEEILPGPIHEIVIRAQALRSRVDPGYAATKRPALLPGKDYVPLPGDFVEGWSNIDGAGPGELIKVGLFVRPDSTLNRVGALGAAVSVGADDESYTVGEVIEAVPNDPDVATQLEQNLIDSFTRQVFSAIEKVATELGNPERSAVHFYTYSDHEATALTEALDRHPELDHARAFRDLLSLDPDGQTGADQEMLSIVQPVLNEYFALQYPNQSLRTVFEQFTTDGAFEAVDPMYDRPDGPPLRGIFRPQFFDERVPVLSDGDRIRLHLASGPLAEGPAAEQLRPDGDVPSMPDFYPIRKRSGGQFPIEYLWAVTPRGPGENQPRLRADIVEEWAIPDEHRELYRQEINRFAFRTSNAEEALERGDVEHLVEQLAVTLLKLVGAVPHKDAYMPKELLDLTRLPEFRLPRGNLPAAARDYVGMEFGNQQAETHEQYHHGLRERARTGRSIPIRVTDMTTTESGGLTITAELAYDELFPDAATATQVAQQARIRDGSGVSGGSWRLLTRLEAVDGDTVEGDSGPSARGQAHRPVGIEKPEDTQYSPPTLVEGFDPGAGTITLSAFPHRFQRYGSRYRVDHCGWHAPTASNVEDPGGDPTERSGYVAGRLPVRLEPGALYILDPMVDDFSAPKTEKALEPQSVESNAFYQQIQTFSQTGSLPPAMDMVSPGIQQFVNRLDEAPDCLSPNDSQEAFITTTDRTIVPLQGPPGTGKTSGALAPTMLARAYAAAQANTPFAGVIVAPSHEAVDASLSGVVELLDAWRSTEDGLADLRLLRVLPSEPPASTERPDAQTDRVEVDYANYHSESGVATLHQAVPALGAAPASNDGDPTQWLMFATPSSLYKAMGVWASEVNAIEGNSAPAAMCHADGLADVVCIDEASMADIPQLFLVTSMVKPLGQTLLLGDHRQLDNITTVDWADSFRKPVVETGAHLSALDYVRRVTVSGDWGKGSGVSGDAQAIVPQVGLTGFVNTPTAAPHGGDADDD